MTFLLDCTLKTSMILAAALVFARLLRRQSAAVRHRILAAGISCAALTPLVSFAVTPMVRLEVPQWMTPTVVRTAATPSSTAGGMMPIEESFRKTAGTSANSKPFPEMDFDRLSQWLWLTGMLLGTAVLGTGSLRLARVASDTEEKTEGPWARLATAVSQEYGLRRSVRLLRSRNSAMLANWGMFFPKILLPADSEDWPEDRIRAVLCHELAHIQRKDWFVQMVTEILRIIFWFNPLFWIVCNRLRLESEYACDNAVLAHGYAGSNYAAHLLDVVRIVNRSNVAWSALPRERSSCRNWTKAVMVFRFARRDSILHEWLLFNCSRTMA